MSARPGVLYPPNFYLHSFSRKAIVTPKMVCFTGSVNNPFGAWAGTKKPASRIARRQRGDLTTRRGPNRVQKAGATSPGRWNFATRIGPNGRQKVQKVLLKLPKGLQKGSTGPQNTQKTKACLKYSQHSTKNGRKGFHLNTM